MSKTQIDIPQNIVDELRRIFCCDILYWRRTGEFRFVSITDDLAWQIIELVVTSNDPIPTSVAAALGLPTGTSYTTAIAPARKVRIEPGTKLRQKADDQMAAPLLRALTPGNPRWNEFADALDATLGPIPEGECLPGKPPWYGCKGDHCHAKEIMAAMGGIDIEASLKFFKSQGGYCDCEILLNVDRHRLPLDL
jgi:hypothetical protein